MYLRFRAWATSGWLPAAILLVATGLVLHRYGVRARDIAIFGGYVACGLALPGMLWLRLLRGRPAHIAEDLTLGLAVGYVAEIATYVAARWIGAPMLFLLWPLSTLALFVAIPGLRRHWRGSGVRAPLAWSWSLAAMLGFVLIYSVQTVFVSQHLSGTDTPYVDMPFHLALIGELRNHVPPQMPYVTGVPLAYHWFFYAEAAATSWATGIEPVTLLYRLSGLPMFVVFVVLTAFGARRLTGRWWTGPVAVAVALFGMVASPYAWSSNPVFDAQTLWSTWISPTNLFGLAMFAPIILVFLDLLQADSAVPRRHWLLLILLIFGCAGAKASLLPLLIAAGLVAVAGVAIMRRRLDRRAATGLVLAVLGLFLADVLIYRGSTDSVVVGLDALREFGAISDTGGQSAPGTAILVMPIAGLFIALVLWSFLWAGAYGLLIRAKVSLSDPRILLVAGVCAGGLGAVSLLSYPGESQQYFVRGAAGAFGILTAAGIAAVVPARSRYLPLIACVAVAAIFGAVVVQAIVALGPATAPVFSRYHLGHVLLLIILPVTALLGVAGLACLVLRFAARKYTVLQGAVPLLLIAVVMGFSLPNVAGLLRTPFTDATFNGPAVPGDGITAARWLRDHSDPNDPVATNLHCQGPAEVSPTCDHLNFWVAAYSERRVLVEGWAYTSKASDPEAAFWDPPLLAANDIAFTDPSAAADAKLYDTYGVRWLFADLRIASLESIGRYADLRYRNGDFAVYELRRP
jgi:hypothetical protein